MDYIRLKGQSTKEGKLLISGKSEMTDYLRRNAGKRILITMQAFDAKTTEAHIGFYFGKVVPDAREGFRKLGVHLTEQETERQLREACPLMQPEYGKKELKTVYDLDRVQMIEYIDWLKQYMAENLYTFVIDPRNI